MLFEFFDIFVLIVLDKFIFSLILNKLVNLLVFFSIGRGNVVFLVVCWVVLMVILNF